MNEAVTKAIEKGLLRKEDENNVFQKGNTQAVWFDKYFLHSVEVAGDEVIYQTAPLADDWLFEEV